MITLTHIHKSYGNRRILHDINLQFPAQQVTSLIGPNGAGKTTLLMLIARLLKPSTGEITLKERNISSIPLHDYAKYVATLRQSPDVNLRLTVEDLVAFGRFPYSRGVLTVQDHQLIDEAISFLSLQAIRHAYIDELSGGQRQMAFLAMTIAQQTHYILLDEPLNNLDIKHAVQIMSALRRLCDEQGRTIIMVIHDINFAANYSDHIVAVKNGTVHSHGCVTEVINQPGLRDLYGIDFTILHYQQSILCNYFNPEPTGV